MGGALCIGRNGGAGTRFVTGLCPAYKHLWDRAGTVAVGGCTLQEVVIGKLYKRFLGMTILGEQVGNSGSHKSCPCLPLTTSLF